MFKAQPNKKYYNKSGQSISFTEDQLKDEATGWLSSDWLETEPIKETIKETSDQEDNMASSSFAYRKSADEQIAEINKDYEQAYKQSQINRVSSFENYRKQMEKEQEEKRIVQKGETGAQNLALSGMSLGRSQSVRTPISKLEEVHRKELDAIASKWMRLAQAAEKDYLNKDYESLNQKWTLIKDLQKQAADEEDKYLEREAARVKEERAATEFEQEQQDRTAEQLTSGLTLDDINSLTYEDINDLADKYGLDVINIYSKINKKREAIQKAEMADFKDYWNIAKDIAEGQEITAPDGTIIKGTKKVSKDIITYDADFGGIKYKVAVDKDTGDIIWKQEIGKATGSLRTGTEARKTGQNMGPAADQLMEDISTKKELKEAMLGYLGQIPAYATYDEAVKDINKYQAKIINDVGQEGYDKILAEVNRQFGVSETPKSATGVQDTSAIKSSIERMRRQKMPDRQIRDAIKRSYPNVSEEQLSQLGIPQGLGEAVGNVFDYLFGVKKK